MDILVQTSLTILITALGYESWRRITGSWALCLIRPVLEISLSCLAAAVCKGVERCGCRAQLLPLLLVYVRVHLLLAFLLLIVCFYFCFCFEGREIRVNTFLLKFFTYFAYQPWFPLPPLFPVPPLPPPLCLHLPQSAPSQFQFRQGKASHGYHQNMA